MAPFLDYKNQLIQPWSRQSVRLSLRFPSLPPSRALTDEETAEGDRLQSPKEQVKTKAEQPQADQSVGKQNDALQRFIERTRRDLEDKERNHRG